MNPNQPPQNPADAVQQAMARRNMGGAQTPQLAQTSPQSQSVNQMPQPASPQAVSGQQVPQGDTKSFQPANQQDFIVASLVEQLKNSQKLDHEKTQMASGILPKSMQTPAGQPQGSAPQMPPPQGSSPFTPPQSMPASQQQGQSPLSQGIGQVGGM